MSSTVAPTHLLVMLPCTVAWLGISSTWLWRDLILLTRFKRLINLSLILVNLISLQCIISFVAFKGLQMKTYPTHHPPLQLTAYADEDEAGCPDTRHSSTGWWCMFFRSSRISWKSKKSKRPFQNHPMKLNIVQCTPMKLSGSNDYWWIWVSFFDHQPLCMLTTLVPSRLPQTPFLMSVAHRGWLFIRSFYQQKTLILEICIQSS